MSAAATTRDAGVRDDSVLGRRRARLNGLVVSIAVLLAMCLISVLVGSKMLPFSDTMTALLEHDRSGDNSIVWDMRVPRTVTCIAVGAALGLAGALIQALTRNPLADTGIFGVNAGAAFAVVLAVGYLGISGVSGYVWFAFAGALLATLMVFLIGAAFGRVLSPARLVVAGLAFGAALSGATSALALSNPDAFDRMRSWQAGSVAGTSLSEVWRVLPLLILGVVLAACVARSLNAVALGSDLARALGTHQNRTRALVVVAVGLLAGGATALAGPIAFVGLMVPHVARWIAGPDQRWILGLSLVLAPILLLAADVVGRLALSPAELPVGIVTAFLGAPVLLLLIRRRRVSRL